LSSKPDPLESRFRATYTSLLNLLDAFKNFEQVREIAQKSFAYQKTARQIDDLRRLRDERTRKLNERLAGNEFGITETDVRGFERLVSARNRLEERNPATRAELRQNWLRENVHSGRIVTQGRSGKRFFLVFNVFGDKVSAMRDDGQGATFALDRVNRIYKNLYDTRAKNIEQAFFDTFEGKNKPLDEPKLSFRKHDADEASNLLGRVIDRIGEADHKSAPPGLRRGADASSAEWSADGVVLFTAPSNKTSSVRDTLLWDSYEDAQYITRYTRDIEFLYSDIWLPF